MRERVGLRREVHKKLAVYRGSGHHGRSHNRHRVGRAHDTVLIHHRRDEHGDGSEWSPMRHYYGSRWDGWHIPRSRSRGRRCSRDFDCPRSSRQDPHCHRRRRCPRNERRQRCWNRRWRSDDGRRRRVGSLRRKHPAVCRGRWRAMLHLPTVGQEPGGGPAPVAVGIPPVTPDMAWMVVRARAGAAAGTSAEAAAVLNLTPQWVAGVVVDPAIRLPLPSGTPRRRVGDHYRFDSLHQHYQPASCHTRRALRPGDPPGSQSHDQHKSLHHHSEVAQDRPPQGAAAVFGRDPVRDPEQKAGGGIEFGDGSGDGDSNHPQR